MEKRLLILVMIMFVPAAYAATINADSCVNADVQAAINSAADGDTVELPACPAGVHWETGYSSPTSTCSTPGWGCAGVQIPNSKGIKLVGQGVGQTVIIPDIAIAIWADTAEGNSPMEITGIEFHQGSGETSQGAIVIMGQAKDWRVHHNKFGTTDAPTTNRDYWIGHVYGSCTYGLWDNNEHHSQGGTGIVSMGSCGGGNYGDMLWQTPVNWGGADWMFFEDNEFYIYGEIGHGGGPDTLGAANIVFRHNYIDDIYGIHGAESGGRPRGHRASDIYNNHFDSRTDNYGAISCRAGTFRIHNNQITSKGGSYGTFMARLWLANWDNSRGPPYGNCRDAPAEGLCSEDYETVCTSDSECSGSCEWVHDPAGDGNGYPCRDQPGRGLDSGVTTEQALEPIYAWSNTGSPTSVECSMPDACTEGIDFFNCVDYDDCVSKGMEPYTTYTYPHPFRGNTSCEPMTISELNSELEQWKSGTININQVMHSIQQWKRGC